ncbi:MAG: hypothetical protein ACHQ7N_07720 [Candidatus Methylomirabilales bacterium]
MGLFAIDYKNVDGQGVYARGGLKFRADEESLRRYFAEILPHVSLNDLIGEATVWLLLPSTTAFWLFPVLLYYLDISFAVCATAAVYLVATVSHFLIYSKPVNHLVLLFSQRVPRLIAYAGWATILLLKGLTMKAIVLGASYLFFGFGVEARMIATLLAPVYAKLFSLPPSDQVLRNVGWYYAEKHGIDPTTWRMSVRK